MYFEKAGREKDIRSWELTFERRARRPHAATVVFWRKGQVEHITVHGQRFFKKRKSAHGAEPSSLGEQTEIRAMQDTYRNL
jgi:hypothetical protein